MDLFSRQAVQDLIDIYDYIFEQSQSAATTARYIQEIENRCYLIAENPYLGRSRANEIGPNLRSFPVLSHVIIYRVADERVQIARVLHGSRDLVKALDRR